MAAPAPAAPSSNALTKVFVGNLSFKTRETELAAAFAPAGTVVVANIITRGPRSLGYGFVEMSNEAEARRAVELMNKKELDGREINVEVAKKAPETGAAAGGDAAPARRGGAARGGGFRGGRGGAPRPAGAPAAAGGAPAAAAGSSDFIPRRPRGGFRGGDRPAGAAGGAPRAPRPPRADAAADPNAPPRTNSATTLFVANLPFLVEDAQLQEIFRDFAPTAAHVVKKRNGKSKGFGFVEFADAAHQQKALALDKKEVQGREIIVKVALSEQVAAEKKEEGKQ
jgi:RNA recognition motif-containing protein